MDRVRFVIMMGKVYHAFRVAAATAIPVVGGTLAIAGVGLWHSPDAHGALPPSALFKLPSAMPSPGPAPEHQGSTFSRGETVSSPGRRDQGREGGGAGEIFRWMDGEPVAAPTLTPDAKPVTAQQKLNEHLDTSCSDEDGKVYKDGQDGYAFCLERARLKKLSIQRAQALDSTLASPQ